MIHCGPRARAPQSGTSRPTCKKRCKVNIVVLSGMLRVPPPFEWRCSSVLSTRTRLAHLISGLRRFAQGPGAHDNLQLIVFSIPPACPQCFLCCGRAGGSGRGPLTGQAWRCGTPALNCREPSHTPVSLIENWSTRQVPSWSWDYLKTSSCITKTLRDRRAIAHVNVLATTSAICNGVHLPAPRGAIRPTIARLRGVRRLPATQRWARILANLS